MKRDEEYEFEANALRRLRVALEKLGIQTDRSMENEFFRAFVHSDYMGAARGGLFIVSHNPGGGGPRAEFSWSRDGKHPMTDVPGAARRIERIIGEQVPERQIAAVLEAEYGAWLIWWSVPARRFWAMPKWTKVEAATVDAADPRELVARMRQIERQIPI